MKSRIQGVYIGAGMAGMLALTSGCSSQADGGAERQSLDVTGTQTTALLSDAQIEAMDLPFLYAGTSGQGGGCNTFYAVRGYRPLDQVRHPLFLYFVGWQQDYATDIAADAVIKAMAKRNYVAINVQYDNTLLGASTDQLHCLFDINGDLNNSQHRYMSLLSRTCGAPPVNAGGFDTSGLSNVDCSKGVITWGHSLGGAMAIYGGMYSQVVKAMWATGVNGVPGNATASPGDSASPPYAVNRRRIRIVNGFNDLGNNSTSGLSQSLGLSGCSFPWLHSCWTGTECVDANGAGFRLVQDCELMQQQLQPPHSADHFWFRYQDSKNVWHLDPIFETGKTTNPQNLNDSIGYNADVLLRLSAL